MPFTSKPWPLRLWKPKRYTTESLVPSLCHWWHPRGQTEGCNLSWWYPTGATLSNLWGCECLPNQDWNPNRHNKPRGTPSEKKWASEFPGSLLRHPQVANLIDNKRANDESKYVKCNLKIHLLVRDVLISNCIVCTSAYERWLLRIKEIPVAQPQIGSTWQNEWLVVATNATTDESPVGIMARPLW